LIHKSMEIAGSVGVVAGDELPLDPETTDVGRTGDHDLGEHITGFGHRGHPETGAKQGHRACEVSARSRKARGDANRPEHALPSFPRMGWRLRGSLPPTRAGRSNKALAGEFQRPVHPKVPEATIPQGRRDQSFWSDHSGASAE